MAKVKLYLAVNIFVIAVIGFGACSPKVESPRTVGGPCEYLEIPGTAKIVSVKEAPSTESNCANAVQVSFDFVPNDPAAVSSYRFPNWKDTGQHFIVGGGMNPPKVWVQERGLVEGSEHACVRSEITKGTCTPVIFSFPKIDMTGWDKYCFEK